MGSSSSPSDQMHHEETVEKSNTIRMPDISCHQIVWDTRWFSTEIKELNRTEGSLIGKMCKIQLTIVCYPVKQEITTFIRKDPDSNCEVRQSPEYQTSVFCTHKSVSNDYLKISWNKWFFLKKEILGMKQKLRKNKKQKESQKEFPKLQCSQCCIYLFYIFNLDQMKIKVIT